MENASKALIMAGGVLVALLIIVVLINGFANISYFQQAMLSEEEKEELIAFNEQYTKYLNQYVYGTDLVSVINNSFNDKMHKLTVTILFNEGYPYTTYKYEYNENTKKIEKKKKDNVVPAGKTLNITNQEDNIVYGMIDVTTKEHESLLRRAFECTNIGYDSKGRVNSISFEEKEWKHLW